MSNKHSFAAKKLNLCSIAVAIMMTLSSAAGASSTGGGPASAASAAANKPVDELLAPTKAPAKAPASNDMFLSEVFLNALSVWDVCITVDARWLARTTSSGVNDIIDVIIKDCHAEWNDLKSEIDRAYPGSDLAEKGIPEDTFVTRLLQRSGGFVKTAISTERSKILDQR